VRRPHVGMVVQHAAALIETLQQMTPTGF
jgi:hypothetical protein